MRKSFSHYDRTILLDDLQPFSELELRPLSDVTREPTNAVERNPLNACITSTDALLGFKPNPGKRVLPCAHAHLEPTSVSIVFASLA